MVSDVPWRDPVACAPCAWPLGALGDRLASRQLISDGYIMVDTGEQLLIMVRMVSV